MSSSLKFPFLHVRWISFAFLSRIGGAFQFLMEISGLGKHLIVMQRIETDGGFARRIEDIIK